MKYLVKLQINLFVPNAPFLYPPENIRKPYGFLMFSGGREREHSVILCLISP